MLFFVHCALVMHMNVFYKCFCFVHCGLCNAHKHISSLIALVSQIRAGKKQVSKRYILDESKHSTRSWAVSALEGDRGILTEKTFSMNLIPDPRLKCAHNPASHTGMMAWTFL